MAEFSTIAPIIGFVFGAPQIIAMANKSTIAKIKLFTTPATKMINL